MNNTSNVTPVRIPRDVLTLRVLRTLFELAQLDCAAHSGLIARALGITPASVASALLRLEAAGLASAALARLTLPGLALATRQKALHLDELVSQLQAPAQRLQSPARASSSPRDRHAPRAAYARRGRAASQAGVETSTRLY